MIEESSWPSALPSVMCWLVMTKSSGPSPPLPPLGNINGSHRWLTTCLSHHYHPWHLHHHNQNKDFKPSAQIMNIFSADSILDCFGTYQELIHTYCELIGVNISTTIHWQNNSLFERLLRWNERKMCLPARGRKQASALCIFSLKLGRRTPRNAQCWTFAPLYMGVSGGTW